MNEFMHFEFLFTLCEKALHCLEAVVVNYGFSLASCLGFIAVSACIVTAGLHILPILTLSSRLAQRGYVLDLLSEVEKTSSTYMQEAHRLTSMYLQLEILTGARLHLDHANMALLVGTKKDKKKARQKLLGASWSQFVKDVPRGDRVGLYKAAISLKGSVTRLEIQQAIIHQTLVGGGWKVVGCTYDLIKKSYKYSYTYVPAPKGLAHVVSHTVDGNQDAILLDTRDLGGTDVV